MVGWQGLEPCGEPTPASSPRAATRSPSEALTSDALNLTGLVFEPDQDGQKSYEPDEPSSALPGGPAVRFGLGGAPHPLGGGRGPLEDRMGRGSGCSGVASDVLRTRPAESVVGVTELERLASLKPHTAASAAVVLEARLSDATTFLVVSCVVSALLS